MPKSLDDIETSSKNIFLFWEGPYSQQGTLKQIWVCLKSILLHEPDASLHLFSNTLQEKDLPNFTPVRWDYAELGCGTPLEGFLPLTRARWALWSDVFRVVCLWRWGGTYMDVDDIMVRPLPKTTNAMAACFLTEEQQATWLPNRIISGRYAAAKGRLAASCNFRLGADPMTNFEAKNPFLERWMREIPHHSPTAWGQELPSKLFSDAPEWSRHYVEPIPWCDLLYHPYDGGHHPEDQRYSGTRITTQVVLLEAEYLEAWPKLIRAYGFYLVKNHKFACHRNANPTQKLLNWAVQNLWKQFDCPK
ncbi:MAG: hypothetical protein KIS67_23450 [Verrucomicrobiae bacterium]|nr:hypothetical protein [Verrucomicrobiae bacterium]